MICKNGEKRTKWNAKYLDKNMKRKNRNEHCFLLLLLFVGALHIPMTDVFIVCMNYRKIRKKSIRLESQKNELIVNLSNWVSNWQQNLGHSKIASWNSLLHNSITTLPTSDLTFERRKKTSNNNTVNFECEFIANFWKWNTSVGHIMFAIKFKFLLLFNYS